MWRVVTHLSGFSVGGSGDSTTRGSSLLRNSFASEMSADGTFTALVADGTDIKRVRITPGGDTSVDTMLAQARAVTLQR
jgi:hypothetical protein